MISMNKNGKVEDKRKWKKKEKKNQGLVGDKAHLHFGKTGCQEGEEVETGGFGGSASRR